jgi:hypothetical protein
MRRLIAVICAAAMSFTFAVAQPQTQHRFDELRHRIDSDKILSTEHKERLRGAVSTAERETAVIDEATQKVLELAGGTTAADPARKAEIDAKVRAELARIGTAHRKLGALNREFELEIERDLTPKQKAEIDALRQKLKDKKLSVEEALADLADDIYLYGLFIYIDFLIPYVPGAK